MAALRFRRRGIIACTFGGTQVPERKADNYKSIASNRRAFHDYEVLERMEAGLVLAGTEIKSVRAGKVSLQDGFARVDSGEGWLENVYIAPYEHGSRYNLESRRRRKLLLHRGELNKLVGRVQEKGLTLVPL